jgi:RsiW-degrading membrane proteinase PrsW (M82 family)
MPNTICCVCNAPIEGPIKTLGGRAFCERHYAKLTNQRKGAWGATLALILGLVVFVLVVFALAPILRGVLGGASLLIVGMVLALVPAAVWLAVFYQQDRLEPEPKGYLIELAILGALLASAVGQPLINNVFRVNQWAGSSLWLKLFAGVFIVGTVKEFLKYAAVRYTIFASQEFDERIDGIIYGAAAGLGYATLLNIAYVIGNGGVDLGIGAIRITVTALAQASFAGITGYFLGRAKFENRGPLWLPAGIALAAILNGIVTAALGEISRTGLRATPLNGLILAAVIAAATFVVLFAVIRRANKAVMAAV